jgi:sugar lactone lactonase YvrE
MRATWAPAYRGTGHLAASLSLLLVGVTLSTILCCADDCPPGTIHTVAGGVGDGGPATKASLAPVAVAVSPDGIVYIADQGSRRIRKVDGTGIIGTVAHVEGVALRAPGWSDGGGPGLALAADGSMYVSDSDGHCIRKLEPDGAITAVAGNGKSTYSGDNGLATEAGWSSPSDVALDPDGALYITDTWNHRIRRIDPAGVITTVAGDGWTDDQRHGRFAGDGGRAINASLSAPHGIAFGPDGSLYIADTGNNRVRKIQAVNGRIDPAGIITTVAGNGQPEKAGVPWLPRRGGGLAIEETLAYPHDVAVAADGSLYIATADAVHRVDTAGTIRVAVGDPWLFDRLNMYRAQRHQRYPGDGKPATDTIVIPQGIALGPDGHLYVADRYHLRVLRLEPDGTLTAIAGNGERAYSGDSGPAIEASLNRPSDVAIGPDGSLYVADTGNDLVRRIDPAGVMTTVAGMLHESTIRPRYGGDGGPATAALLNSPAGLAPAPDGSLYIADTRNYAVRKVDPAGIITTIAGGRFLLGDPGDGGPARDALLHRPTGLALGPDGSLYIADSEDHRIRRIHPLNGRIDPAGIITTVAGNGKLAYAGDGGPAVEASLAAPSGVAVAADGTIYIGDAANHRIRKVGPDGIITTIAGTGRTADFGDLEPAIEAAVCPPCAVAIGPDGSVYVADYPDGLIRRIGPDGAITSVAGAGKRSHPPDTGIALQTYISPWGLAVGTDGSIYIADTYKHCIHRVCPALQGDH